MSEYQLKEIPRKSKSHPCKGCLFETKAGCGLALNILSRRSNSAYGCCWQVGNSIVVLAHKLTDEVVDAEEIVRTQ